MGKLGPPQVTCWPWFGGGEEGQAAAGAWAGGGEACRPSAPPLSSPSMEGKDGGRPHLCRKPQAGMGGGKIDEEERRVPACFVEYAILFYHVFFQTSTMDGPRPMGSSTRPLAISVAQEMPPWKHWRILNKRSRQLHGTRLQMQAYDMERG